MIDAIKFGYLEGSVSLPSDSNGIAKFTNLTVKNKSLNY